jgi:hypothetical protein
MRATIQKATASTVVNIAPLIREEDVAEVYAVSGKDVLTVLIEACQITEQVYVAVRGEALIAIFGVTPHPTESHAGIPWMLATPEMEKHHKDLLRIAPEYIERMHSQYPILSNMVDARNTKAINWLAWCGFSFPKRFDHYGYERRPFLQFIRYSKCVE